MENAAQQFENELEIFRCESEETTQHFYAFLTVHAAAADHPSVYNLLNEAPLFWNTCLRALQTAHLVALGRVFDQGSPHNVDRLLRIAQKHPQIFSKEALGRRKQANRAHPPDWLPTYLERAYQPKPNDFRRIRGVIRKWRRIYEDRYRPLRHKIFAHADLANKTEIAQLFAKTNIRELQRLHSFLGSLYEGLWQLFFNGRKPVMRPQRYSVKRMRALGTRPRPHGTVQEDITAEAERFLVSASRLTPVAKALR